MVLEEQSRMLSQAREQIKSYRSAIEQKQAEAERARQQLEKAQAKLSTPTAVRSANLEGLRRRNLALGTIGTQQTGIQQYKQQLTSYEKELETQEKTVAAAQSEISEYQRQVDDYNIAKRVFERGGNPMALSPTQRVIYRDLANYQTDAQNAAVQSAISKVESSLQMTLTPEVKNKIANQLMSKGEITNVDIQKILGKSGITPSPDTYVPKIQTIDLRKELISTSKSNLLTSQPPQTFGATTETFGFSVKPKIISTSEKSPSAILKNSDILNLVKYPNNVPKPADINAQKKSSVLISSTEASQVYIPTESYYKPYGFFGWAKEKVYSPFEATASYLERRMNPQKITQKTGLVEPTYDVGGSKYIAEKEVEIPNIFAGSIRTFGGFVAAPLKGMEKVSGLITKKEVRKGYEELQPRQKVEETLDIAGGLFMGAGIAAAAVPKVRSSLVSFKGEYVPSEQVFSKEVLAGKSTFPMTGSVKESLTRFEAGKEGEAFVVQTSTTKTPKPIDISKAGLRGQTGLEDPGIYVTPKGEGSPYFLNIMKKGQTEYTLNPLKPLLTSVKETPGVIRFRVKSIERQPKEIITKPGFGPTEEYLSSQKDTGKVFITKRSEIGVGEIKSQPFILTKRINKEKGIVEEVKPYIRFEQGTREIEGIIPAKATIYRITPKGVIGKLKGYKQYTTLEGVNIPLRDYSLLGEGEIKGITFGKDTIKPISEGELKKLSYDYYKDFGKSYETPYGKTIYPSSTTSQVSSKPYLIPPQASNKVYSYPSKSDISYSIRNINPVYQGISYPNREVPKGYSLKLPSANYSFGSGSSQTKPTSPTYSYTPGISRRLPPTPSKRLTYPSKQPSKLSSGLSKLGRGYKTFIIKRGKKQYLPGITPRGKAIIKGEKVARQTLRATFGIEESGTTSLPDVNYAPSKEIFREYKIRKGKVVPIKDTWIQRAGKRLSSRSEVGEIQRARKNLMGGKLKWF